MHATPTPQNEQRPFTPTRHHHVPPGTGTFGMTLFLIAIGIVFVASMLAFLFIRFSTLRPLVNEFTGQTEREAAPPIGSIHMPVGLWASTAVILLSSFTMHRAVENVRHERQTRFRNMLLTTLLLAIGFILVQVPCLAELLREHMAHREQNIVLYGSIFFLILLHALHVVGGIVPMVVTNVRARNNAYDHEHFGPIRYLSMYWHFLDGVWLVMFAVLLIAG